MVSSREGTRSLRLVSASATWHFIRNFTFSGLLRILEKWAPIKLHVLRAAAIPEVRGLTPIANYTIFIEPGEEPDEGQHQVLGAQDSEQGGDWAPNTGNYLQFTAFQMIVEVWLFAHTAQYIFYAVLGKMGLTVSYTTVLSLFGLIEDVGHKILHVETRDLVVMFFRPSVFETSQRETAVLYK